MSINTFKFINQSKSFALLAPGFALVIGSFITVTIVGLNYMEDLSSNLSDVVNEYNLRSNLGHAMRNAARERSMILLEMIRTEDVFDRDDLYMELRNQGTIFLIAREAILQTDLEPTELQILKEQREHSKIAGPLQHQVVDLLNEQSSKEASALLIKKAIPAQNRVLKALENFIELQARHNEQALARTSSKFETNIRSMLLIALSGILVSIIVAFIVMRRINYMMAAQTHAEKELKDINSELETIVNKRTSDLQIANEKLERAARYDYITDLPNRLLFSEVVERMMARSTRFNQSMAIFFLDLDGFKLINDKYGHDVGDQLLRQVSQRFKQSIRKEDLLARFGGDEFTIVFGDISDSNHLQVMAEKIIEQVMRPFIINGAQCEVGVSIGISVFPKDGSTIEMLLKRADEAMYHTKETGKNNFYICENHLN